MKYLVRHAGQVVTRTILLEATWQYDFEPRRNIIDMHVHRLRVAGAGYMVRGPSEADGTVMPPV